MIKRLKLPRQLWIILVGVVLLAGLAWAAIQGGPLATTRVTVTKVVRGDVTPGISGIGTLAAQRAYVLGPTVAGRVQRVLVDVGDTVKAGQLLAEMEPVDLDARSAAANASALRAASAVAAAEAQLHDARSRQKLAASDLRRNLDLGSKGFLSASAIEAKRQQLESADAQLGAAEATLTSARQDRLRLEAELSGTRQQRGNLRLLATADATVTSREAEPGSTVVAGQAVLKLADMASLRVRTRLDQSRSAGLRSGQAARIVLRSRAGESFPGRLVRIDPQSDSVTEERLVDVAFERLPDGMTIGELAEVTLQLPTVTKALLIPNAALRQHDGRSGVWLLNGGRPRFVAVQTGARGFDGAVQVRDGLQEGDAVIVYSERELADNQRIEVFTSLNGGHAP